MSPRDTIERSWRLRRSWEPSAGVAETDPELAWSPENPLDEGLTSTVRAGEHRLVSVLRRRRDMEMNDEPVKNSWIDSVESLDGGISWSFLGKVAATHSPDYPSNGNPPALLRLADQRLVCAYGYRSGEQSGIRARFAPSSGRPWGEEIVIRDGAQYGDMGYPRMVQRPDGKLVTVYYIDDTPEGERYIGGTIWRA